MKVLIIGGTGLISTGIVKALVARGDSVTVFNRGKTENRLPAGVEVMVGDRGDVQAFEKAFEGRVFNVVMDMICFRPDEAEADVRIFVGKTRHFIFCSTVCTYGNTQTVIPTLESTPQRPHSGYGKNKARCEEIFMRAHEVGQMAVTIMRPSHTFGPGGGVINNLNTDKRFVDRLRKGKVIIVSGDGHGLWQSAYCDDVGAGFAAAAGRKETFGETYNIVGGEVATWDEYVRRTAAAIGAPEPRIVHVPTDVLLAIDAPRYRSLAEIFRYHGVYSNEKILRDVPEYRPVTAYEEGVRRTVAWMDAHGTVENSDGDDLEDRIADEIVKVAERVKKGG